MWRSPDARYGARMHPRPKPSAVTIVPRTFQTLRLAAIIFPMTVKVPDPLTPALPSSVADLRTAMTAEYFAIFTVVNQFDDRFMLVKGWSVTLSLTALGLGFINDHYGLFLLAVLSSLGFWLVEASMKKHQMRYYARMRDIEVAAYDLNHQLLGQHQFSSPKVDWWWSFGIKDRPVEPVRRTEQDVAEMMRNGPWMVWVLFPHAVAFVAGVVLFWMGLSGASVLNGMPL